MRAIIKEVGQKPRVTDIENTLEALQQAVGGYIEVINLNENTVLICDEEGKIKDKPFNFVLSGVDVIVGDVLFVNTSGEDFTDIDEETEQTLIQLFNK